MVDPRTVARRSPNERQKDRRVNNRRTIRTSSNVPSACGRKVGWQCGEIVKYSQSSPREWAIIYIFSHFYSQKVNRKGTAYQEEQCS